MSSDICDIGKNADLERKGLFTRYDFVACDKVVPCK